MARLHVFWIYRYHLFWGATLDQQCSLVVSISLECDFQDEVLWRFIEDLFKGNFCEPAGDLNRLVVVLKPNVGNKLKYQEQLFVIFHCVTVQKETPITLIRKHYFAQWVEIVLQLPDVWRLWVPLGFDRNGVPDELLVKFIVNCHNAFSTKDSEGLLLLFAWVYWSWSLFLLLILILLLILFELLLFPILFLILFARRLLLFRVLFEIFLGVLLWILLSSLFQRLLLQSSSLFGGLLLLLLLFLGLFLFLFCLLLSLFGGLLF